MKPTEKMYLLFFTYFFSTEMKSEFIDQKLKSRTTKKYIFENLLAGFISFFDKKRADKISKITSFFVICNWSEKFEKFRRKEA